MSRNQSRNLSVPITPGMLTGKFVVLVVVAQLIKVAMEATISCEQKVVAAAVDPDLGLVVADCA